MKSIPIHSQLQPGPEDMHGFVKGSCRLLIRQADRTEHPALEPRSTSVQLAADSTLAERVRHDAALDKPVRVKASAICQIQGKSWIMVTPTTAKTACPSPLALLGWQVGHQLPGMAIPISKRRRYCPDQQQRW